MGKVSFIAACLLCCALPLLSNAEEAPPRMLGVMLFKQHCMICHGEHADGQSQLGRLMQPHPANLTLSSLSAVQRELIIRKGGAAVGRSDGMPAWELELSNADIATLVSYLGTLTHQ